MASSDPVFERTLSKPGVMSKRKTLRALNNFAYSLYGELSAEMRNKNVLIAPTSVSAALAMTLCGAREGTRAEMIEGMALSKVKKIPAAIITFHKQFGQVWRDILKANSNDSVSLEVSNKLWLQDEMSVCEKFTTDLRECYEADIGRVNFINDPESARKEINNWIPKHSKDEQIELLSEDDLSNQMRFLIINVLNFKGLWLSPFDSANLEKRPFHCIDRKTDVDMMYKEAFCGLIDSSDFNCQVLILKYYQSSLRMLIILPKKVDGIYELEKKILSDGSRGDNISKWVSESEKEEVSVYLPKFKISQRHDLVTSLKSLGINELFTVDADLTGISCDEKLHVNGFNHEVSIEVNEEGTKARSRSFSRGIIASGPKTSEFNADHPFLFCIFDQDTGIIVMWGRFCNPEDN